MVEIQGAGGVKNVQELEEEAHEALVHEREEQLAQNLKGFVGNSSKKFDPVLQSVSLIDDSLVNWSPETKSEAAPANDKQKKFLDRHGFDATGWKSGYADRVIDIMKARADKGLASPKQVRCLLKNGYPRAHNLSFDQASAAMEVLSKKWARMKKYKKRR